MWTTGQSVPTGKEQETLLTSHPIPLSFLSLTFPILPLFSSSLVLDIEIWSKGPQPELRIGDRSPPLGRELEFWFWSGLISGRAEFQSSLLWRPRVKSHNAWVSTGGRRCLKGHPFCPPPASSHFFFQPGFLSSLWNLWRPEIFSFTLLVLGSEVLCLYRRFSETVFLYLREYPMRSARFICVL